MYLTHRHEITIFWSHSQKEWKYLFPKTLKCSLVYYIYLSGTMHKKHYFHTNTNVNNSFNEVVLVNCETISVPPVVYQQNMSIE